MGFEFSLATIYFASIFDSFEIDGLHWLLALHVKVATLKKRSTDRSVFQEFFRVLRDHSTFCANVQGICSFDRGLCDYANTHWIDAILENF
jgi:hypothetical protein